MLLIKQNIFVLKEMADWLEDKIVGFKSEKNFGNIKVQICSLRSSILLKYGADKEIIQKMVGWAEWAEWVLHQGTHDGTGKRLPSDSVVKR